MVEAATGRVALLSIRPEFAWALLSGKKRVEFRRQPLAADVTRVVIYATAPVRLIIGAFEVAGVERHTPASAWARYSREGGIGRAAFDRYYAGASVAVVIRALHPRAADRPIPLDDIRVGMRPPQSFMYLSNELLPAGIYRLPPARAAQLQLGRPHALAGLDAGGLGDGGAQVRGWVEDGRSGQAAVTEVSYSNSLSDKVGDDVPVPEQSP